MCVTTNASLFEMKKGLKATPYIQVNGGNSFNKQRK